jgi:hypothetical protein
MQLNKKQCDILVKWLNSAAVAEEAGTWVKYTDKGMAYEMRQELEAATDCGCPPAGVFVQEGCKAHDLTDDEWETVRALRDGTARVVPMTGVVVKPWISREGKEEYCTHSLRFPDDLERNRLLDRNLNPNNYRVCTGCGKWFVHRDTVSWEIPEEDLVGEYVEIKKPI